jgi:hypothetical protein
MVATSCGDPHEENNTLIKNTHWRLFQHAFHKRKHKANSDHLGPQSFPSEAF